METELARCFILTEFCAFCAGPVAATMLGMRFGLKSLLFFAATEAAIIWWSIHWPVRPAPLMISYRFDFDSRPPIGQEIIVRIILGTIGLGISWVAGTYIIQRLRRTIS